MNEQDALLETIFDNPEDDAPRLIYSDWLEEHDLPGYAEFIRDQIRRSRLFREARDAKEATRKDFPGPMTGDHPSWKAYVAELSPASTWRHLLKVQNFIRGFHWQTLIVSVSELSEFSRDWWPLFPITTVVCPLSPLTISEFVRIPYLARLRELIIEGEDPYGLVTTQLARCHYLKSLRVLDLDTYNLGFEAIEALVNSDVFNQLTELRMPGPMRPNGSSAQKLKARFGDICVF